MRDKLRTQNVWGLCCATRPPVRSDDSHPFSLDDAALLLCRGDDTAC
jgi:hypothetical protein